MPRMITNIPSCRQALCMAWAPVPGVLLLLASMAAPMSLAIAQTKMFKCVVDGSTVYQQTACPVTPLQSETASAPQTTSASALALSPRRTKREKTAAQSAMSASTPPSSASPTDGPANTLP